MHPLAAALVALGLCAACGGSINADARLQADLDAQSAEARADADVEAAAEHDRPVSNDERARTRSLIASGPGEEPVPLLGARHNVKIKSSEGAVACRCVSVLLGPASMHQLAWEGVLPRTNAETQLVVAFVPDAGECPGAPKGSRGPSYWGYRIQGNDVVVLLEEWKPKPPQTLAAIIPKPPSGGQVYVAPVSRTLPYGRSTDDKTARCALGNPGPARGTPLGAHETGTSRPDPPENPVAE